MPVLSSMLIILIGSPPAADAHGHMKTPRSRNLYAAEDSWFGATPQFVEPDLLLGARDHDDLAVVGVELAERLEHQKEHQPVVERPIAIAAGETSGLGTLEDTRLPSIRADLAGVGRVGGFGRRRIELGARC